MSVKYYVNKKIRLGDLKKVGLKVEDCRNEKCDYPFLVSNGVGEGLAVSELYIEDDDQNEDNWIIKEFEGKFSMGGGCCMLDICDKLDCQFVTDEDIDDLLYTNQDELTDEMYKNRTEKFRKELIKES